MTSTPITAPVGAALLGPGAGGGVAAGVDVEDLYSAFIHAPSAVAVMTITGEVTAGNPGLSEILARPLPELLGGTLFRFTHTEDLPAARAACEAIGVGEVSVIHLECRFVRPGGDVVWARVSTSRVEAHRTRAAHLIMHILDISEQKTLEAALSRQALHDPLTGLGNRALLDQLRESPTTPRGSYASTAGGPGSVVTGLVIVDLDGFKALNDAHGHHVGDAALVEVARRVRCALGRGETPVRLGGDEFAVWLPATTATRIEALVQALRTGLSVPYRVGDRIVALSASIGAAKHALPATPTDDTAVAGRRRSAVLLRAADEAMYEDKRRPR